MEGEGDVGGEVVDGGCVSYVVIGYFVLFEFDNFVVLLFCIEYCYFVVVFGEEFGCLLELFGCFCFFVVCCVY